MDLGRQWNERLRVWAEQFQKHYYRQISSMELSFFTTMDWIPAERAAKMSFAPAPEGMKWGKKWEYGWFRASITVPEELEGRRVVFTLGAGEEMLVFVNGREAGSIDKRHKFITLTRKAKAGERYDILAECYAGHGPRIEGGGPVAYGDVAVPEPLEPQVTVGKSHFGVWNEELFRVSMDYLTLYSLLDKLPERSLRAMKTAKGLKNFTLIADFELPEPELTQSVIKAGEELKPLLECKNGSTAPVFTAFGQSHLDLAWLWPVEETMRKSARTYSNQLALMEEYPDYRFLLCEPPILEWLAKLYPDLYARVKRETKNGRFYPEGAVWVESDTNLPSGESLIRQFVYGKRWFRREFDVETRLAWMPDTFGFSGALPQIMKKCGVEYFATQKLSRQDPEAEPFPYNTFWWEGIDGSRVLAHFFKKNNAVLTAGELVDRWERDRVQREDIDGMLFPFGYGDGGGGPTREMVETLLRCRDLEGAPRCRIESPVDFFERQSGVENVYKGELYLAWHRGTYTAQAKTKRGIRKAEIALKMAEHMMARRALAGEDIPDDVRKAIDGLWRTLLFNEFHDIAPGSSIARVHERVERELGGVIDAANELTRKLAGPEGDIIYNHLSWPRNVRGVLVPAQGSAKISDRDPFSARCEHDASGGFYELSNLSLTCRVDGRGQLVSVKRAGSDREYLSAPGNRFLMFRDVNTSYDAWELMSMYEKLPVELDAPAKISVIRDGLGVGLHVERALGSSYLCQDIRLDNGSDRVDFKTSVDWRESHRILKVAFPVNVYATEAAHEIQFGCIKRPTHRSRQYDRDRYEVCAQRYTALSDGAFGAAVLNDCKYGVSVADSEIRLTLLRSPLMPDMTADRGEQSFTYAFYPFDGPLCESDVLRRAVELNEPPIYVSSDAFSSPVMAPARKNIVVDTVKPSDTDPHAILVRAFETMGMATDTDFTLSPCVRKIAETDMLEENPTELKMPLRVSFGPFEIKTFLMYPDKTLEETK